MQSGEGRKKRREERNNARKKMLEAEEKDRIGLSEEEEEDDDELVVENPEVLRAQRNRMLRNVAIVFGIIVVVCIIIVIIALTQKSTVSTEGVVILVSIDAFRVDYLKRTWVKMPNIRNILANGVRTEALISSFPSKTFPVNIHTIFSKIIFIFIYIIIFPLNLFI